MTVTAAADARACCAAVYGSEAARFLLGDSFHPGGPRLTRRLVAALGVSSTDTVVDVASGAGASSVLVAGEVGCGVVGLDVAVAALAAARARAAALPLAATPRFVAADAERLPLRDASAAGILCECALCLFTDRPAAAREMARVLRPGGRVALSDVTAWPSRLPDELRSLAAQVACIGTARPLIETVELLEGAGLVVEVAEEHDDVVREMIGRIAARLRVARWLGAGPAGSVAGPAGSVEGPLARYIDEAERVLAAAARAAADRALGYGVVVARRPA